MWLIVGGAFLMTCIMTWFFKSYAARKQLLDQPNERSSHTRVTPRGGGVVFVGIWTCCIFVACNLGLLPWLLSLVVTIPALVVAGIGFIDDLRGLKARTRMAVHLIATIIVVFLGGGLPEISFGATTITLGFFGYVVAVLGIVWSINLFNFMDGTDGLAACEALFILGCGGGLLWYADASDFALMAWILSAAVAGFLVWNWPPAKIFMGDVGSGFLGFMIGVLAYLGARQSNTPLWCWLLLYALFCADATVTLVRRIYRKEKWYAAHRSHAYQRLHHSAGWSHRQILIAAISVNALLCALAIWVGMQPASVLIALPCAAALLIAVLFAVERKAPMQFKP